MNSKQGMFESDEEYERRMRHEREMARIQVEGIVALVKVGFKIVKAGIVALRTWKAERDQQLLIEERARTEEERRLAEAEYQRKRVEEEKAAAKMHAAQLFDQGRDEEAWKVLAKFDLDEALDTASRSVN